ncbi:MAG: archease [Candidatus Woesearchaeota archaeon]
MISKSKKFEYLDHTADVMFISYGKTLNKAFENSGLAIFNILTDIKKVKQIKKISFKIEAKTIERLLYDFIDELIFYQDTENLIFSKFKIKIKKNKKDNKYLLQCEAYGDSIKNYETHGHIKSPTYNEMEIKKKGLWKIKSVVDI